MWQGQRAHRRPINVEQYQLDTRAGGEHGKRLLTMVGKAKGDSRLRIRRWKRSVISNSKSVSLSTLGRPSAESGGQLLQPRFQQIEIDRLGDEFHSAKFRSAATALVVAVGSHHHHGKFGSPLFETRR
jgi:hypothetical protein